MLLLRDADTTEGESSRRSQYAASGSDSASSVAATWRRLLSKVSRRVRRPKTDASQSLSDTSQLKTDASQSSIRDASQSSIRDASLWQHVLATWRRRRQSDQPAHCYSWADLSVPSALLVQSKGENRREISDLRACQNEDSFDMRRSSDLGPKRHSCRINGSESGYVSNSSSVLTMSTPSTPKRPVRPVLQRGQKTQSMMSNEGNMTNVSSGTRTKSLDSGNNCNLTTTTLELALGEWLIPVSELVLPANLIANNNNNNNNNSNIVEGRWHGNVAVHVQLLAKPESRLSFLRVVRTLTQIRHENLVLYMGASIDVERNLGLIVTTHLSASSLFANLHENGKCCLEDELKLRVGQQLCNALGYLHARGIVHGRLSSRNVFLERRVQLSLLDYGQNCSNVNYSSPQILAQNEDFRAELRGKSGADDVFAFGTLLFELFSNQLPLHNRSASTVAKTILEDNFPKCLSAINTERLRRVIRACWQFEPRNRIDFERLGSLFATLDANTMGAMSRRQSTSEPNGIDQIGNSAGLVTRERNDSSTV